ncbi:FtsX-like permease family protein [Patescibacteria group bacterium]|nr:MAG: FtsX-like permease family protein [Patescibacteria group bacterium]
MMRKKQQSKVTKRPVMNDLQKKEHVLHSKTRPIALSLILSLALKNLAFKKLRTSLTALGVVIGVGSVVFLFAFATGLQNLVSKQVIDSKSVKTIDVSSARSKVVRLDEDSQSKMKSIGSVQDVTRIYNAAGKLSAQQSQLDAVVYGVDRSYLELSSIKLLHGSMLTKDESNVALVNSALAKALGIDQDKIVGQTIRLSFTVANTNNETKQSVEQQFTVKGVVDGAAGAEAYIGSGIFEQNGANVASNVKILVTNQQDVAQVRREIESLGFSTTSPLDTLDQINQVFGLLQLILIGFGGIGVIIAILGMFNTLTISLLERTREIGLMVTLGARQRDVKRMFIVESLALSVIGGLLGIVGAWLLGIGANVALNAFAQSRGVTEQVSTFSFPPTLIAATLVLSAVMGLLVAYFPARRAASIDPIEALRNE